MEDFARLAEISGSDKYSHHGYHRFYPYHLERFRQSEGNILEIGINTGSSLRLWKDYFGKAFIHGADIGFFEEGDRYKVHQVDQSDRNDLDRLCKAVGQAFFVIDDGSHIPGHQISSFDMIFDSVVEPGGIYIIEDIEVSYWRRGELYGYKTQYGIHASTNLVEVCKDLIEVINIEFVNDNDRAGLFEKLSANGLRRDTIGQIASVEFCHNCIIFRKKYSWENQYSQRSYRSNCNT